MVPQRRGVQHPQMKCLTVLHAVAEVRGSSKQPRVGSGMSQLLPDRPPDEVFQVKVHNGGNSCYMDSVLYAMFATPSSALDSLLTSRTSQADPTARLKQDLQGVILKQFVSRIRHYESITADMVNNIRLQCRKMGWEYTGAPDQQQDAGEFFSFLYTALGGQLVRTMRKTFTGALPDNSDKGREENMALLPLALFDAQTSEPLQLGALLDSFFYENVATGLRRKVVGEEQEVCALNTYSIENVPCLAAVSLKRFDDQLLKIESHVDFPSHINLHKYSSRPEWRGSPVMHSVPWNLRSIVCHRGGSTLAGHYYAYTRYSAHETPNAVWLRMDDAGSPCITQSNVWADPYVKSEAVLFLYELDTDAHTAALLMLQEEEHGDLDDLAAFTVHSFPPARSQSAIPTALPPSFLSSVLAGMQAGSSHSARSASQTASARSGDGGAGGGGASEARKAAEGETDSNQEAVPMASDDKGGGQTMAGAEAGKAEDEGVTAKTAGEALVRALQGAEGAEAQLPELMVAANGSLPTAPVKKHQVDREGQEVWECPFVLPEGREPLLCVSALSTLSWEGLVDRQVAVTVSKEGDETAPLLHATLQSEEPSSILPLPYLALLAC